MNELTLRYNMQKKFSNYQGDLRDQARLAYIGDQNGNIFVDNRPGYIWVSLNDAPPIQVFNKRVQAMLGMPVLIGYDPYEPWLLQVLTISTPSSDALTLGTLPAAMHVGPHADSHQMNGSDPVSLTKRNLTDGLVAPGDYTSGSAMVDVWGDVVFAGGAWREITDTTVDLSSHIPSSGSSRFVLVAVDTSGSIVTIDGSIVNGLVPDLTTIPTLPYGYVGLGAVRLYGGMPYVSENDQYTDIVDTRGSGWELRNFTSVGNALPQSVGLVSSVGTSGSASRDDHVHAHGNLTGGLLHSIVTTGSPGFAPTLNGDATYYLDGTGNWSIPAGSGSGGMSGSAAPTPLSDAIPQPLGVASAGTSGSASRGDHVHAHGNLVGGALHDLATSGSPGFLPILSGVPSQFLSGSGTWIVPSSSSLSLGAATPQAVGTVGFVGTSGSASHEDHVHAHGNLVGGTLHNLATSGSPGFLPTLSGSPSQYLDGSGNWTVPTGSGSAGTFTPLSDATPQSLGTASAGTSGSASRGDHVHAHGNLVGGSLHALATSGSAGFLPVLSGSSTLFLNGTGAWTTPAGSGSSASVDILRFFVDGRLAILTNVSGAVIFPFACTILNAYMYLENKGSSGSTIVDVNKNGTSIFTTQSHRPTIQYNDVANAIKTLTPDDQFASELDILTIDIDQVASGAEGLSVVLSLLASGSSALIEVPPSFALDGYKPGTNTDNIALPLGTSGAWDDFRTNPQSIVIVGGIVYLFYRGNDGSSWGNGLAYANVEGFTGTNWTKHSANPITSLPGVDTVIYDVDAGVWKCWYSSSGSIGYATATSPQGPWTLYGSNPVMSPGATWEHGSISHVRVLREGVSAYKMLYTGGDVSTNSQIGMATSPDGIAWTKYASNPVLGPSGSDWMQFTTFCPTVPVKVGGTYYIYFNGKYRTGGASDYSRIGSAYSSDLITWTKDNTSAGAILNATRTWEGVNSPPGEVEFPTYVQVGTKQYIFYDTWWGSPSVIGLVVIP